MTNFQLLERFIISSLFRETGKFISKLTATWYPTAPWPVAWVESSSILYENSQYVRTHTTESYYFRYGPQVPER